MTPFNLTFVQLYLKLSELIGHAMIHSSYTLLG